MVTIIKGSLRTSFPAGGVLRPSAVLRSLVEDVVLADEGARPLPPGLCCNRGQHEAEGQDGQVGTSHVGIWELSVRSDGRSVGESVSGKDGSGRAPGLSPNGESLSRERFGGKVKKQVGAELADFIQWYDTWSFHSFVNI